MSHSSHVKVSLYHRPVHRCSNKYQIDTVSAGQLVSDRPIVFLNTGVSADWEKGSIRHSLQYEIHKFSISMLNKYYNFKTNEYRHNSRHAQSSNCQSVCCIVPWAVRTLIFPGLVDLAFSSLQHCCQVLLTFCASYSTSSSAYSKTS